MSIIKCISCQNHASHEMKCNIGSDNYNKGELAIKECFVLSNWLKALDKAIDNTDKMIEVLSRKKPTS